MWSIELHTGQKGEIYKMQQNEFIRLVKEMRHAQKCYFANRTSENLKYSKQIEAEVDKAINDWEIRDIPKQGNLLK